MLPLLSLFEDFQCSCGCYFYLVTMVAMVTNVTIYFLFTMITFVTKVTSVAIVIFATMVTLVTKVTNISILH